MASFCIGTSSPIESDCIDIIASGYSFPIFSFSVFTSISSAVVCSSSSFSGSTISISKESVEVSPFYL